MNVRTYRAATPREAMQLVKEDLGDDALILEMRRIDSRRPGGGREGDIEITAMPGNVVEVTTERTAVERSSWDRPYAPVDRYAEQAPGRIAAGGDTTDDLPVVPAWNAQQQSDFECFRQFHIPEQLAMRLASVSGTCSPGTLHPLLARVIESAVPAYDLAEASAGRVVAAFIGPTGVGKTTTIAKLATVFSRARNWRAVLVAADTYRAGGVAQLRTFADLLELPMYTVYTRGEFEAVLRDTSNADIVFVDTPGCNPYDHAMLSELRNLLGARDPIACCLTLAMTADYGELADMGQRFALLNPTGLVLTKLDETSRSAALVGLAYRLRLPLHYVCTGPTVPDDISLATPVLMADLLVQALDRHRARNTSPRIYRDARSWPSEIP